ncbi:hypothetical protein JK361_31985 [Streptomyces sp. 5-8]|uniref:Uncharacterized protein n=1 Tax=Streptomyces musisoli TaxID=2802280 RepID=A0ABS1P9V0_9ACTN|nr:hypothetical protein [Streptomyces musisoli]
MTSRRTSRFSASPFSIQARAARGPSFSVIAAISPSTPSSRTMSRCRLRRMPSSRVSRTTSRYSRPLAAISSSSTRSSIWMSRIRIASSPPNPASAALSAISVSWNSAMSWFRATD